MATVLFAAAETLRRIALLTQAFMPDASARILDQLAVPHEARTLGSLGAAGALRPGTPIPPPSGVFPRRIPPAGHAETDAFGTAALAPKSSTST
jgi:methionyl-tRNA synthetase